MFGAGEIGRLCVAAIISLLCHEAQGQQFRGALRFDFPIDGLSDSCITAINTDLECHTMLAGLVEPHKPLNPNQLAAVCTDECTKSLAAIQSLIKEKCVGEDDVTVEGGITYPATYRIDRYILEQSKACMKDDETDQYCETLLRTFMETKKRPANWTCSKCNLDTTRLMIDSPFINSSGLIDAYTAQASECGIEVPAISPPTQYAVRKPEPVQVKILESRPCDSPYEIVDGDTCNSIAVAQNVSTFSLIYKNNLDVYCSNLPAAGEVICLPEPCQIYIVKESQDCWNVDDDVARNGRRPLTSNLIKWNPNLTRICKDLSPVVGTAICVSAPGSNGSSPASQGKISEKKTSRIVDVQCERWQKIPHRPIDCAFLVAAFQLDWEDFIALNPSLDYESACRPGTVLLPGDQYCIRGSYTDDQGLVKNNTAGTVREIQLAEDVQSAPTGEIKIDMPWLGENLTTSMSEGVTFIVTVSDSHPATSTNDAAVAAATGTCAPLAPTMPGTHARCECFINVYGFDKDAYGCDQIVNDHAIDVAWLIEHNSWIQGDDCTAGVYADLGENEQRSICVRAS